MAGPSAPNAPPTVVHLAASSDKIRNLDSTTAARPYGPMRAAEARPLRSAVSATACGSRIPRRQSATGSWRRSLQWETHRTWFRSAGATVCLPANVSGVWLCFLEIPFLLAALMLPTSRIRFSATMPALLSLLLTLRESVRSRAAFQVEILALRHQLQVLERSLASTRPSSSSNLRPSSRGIGEASAFSARGRAGAASVDRPSRQMSVAWFVLCRTRIRYGVRRGPLPPPR
jgi:hypothetical protein